MNFESILITIIIIIIIMIAFRISYEKFSNIGQIPIPINSYLEKPTDYTQINQVFYPFYNYPEYIGKYPYYRFMFHPYSSSVYYT